jgi:DNA-binding NtrC family response regulator
MERMTILCENTEIQPEDLPEKILKNTELKPKQKPASASFSWPTIKDMQYNKMNLKDFLDRIEKNLLIEALKRAQGVKNKAAEILGIKRTTLIEKLKKKKIS